jgi:hypothetical protein
LLFYEAFADDLVDRRFDEARGDRLAIPIAFAGVRNQPRIGGEVDPKVAQRSQQAAAFGGELVVSVQKEFQNVDGDTGLVDVAVPQILLAALQFLEYSGLNSEVFAFQSLGHLRHDGDTHRHMKPIEQRSYWIPGSYETSSSMSAPNNALPRFRTL